MSAYDLGKCSVCGLAVYRTVKGTARRHTGNEQEPEFCPGSGKPAAPVQRGGGL